MLVGEKETFFKDLLSNLQGISSTNEKRQLVEHHKESLDHLRDELNLMFSGKKFGMSVETITSLWEEDRGPNMGVYDDYLTILKSNKKANEISNDLKHLISIDGAPTEGKFLIISILSDSLRIGSGHSIFSDFIKDKPVFTPTLANDLSKKRDKVAGYLASTRVLGSPKIDGRRATITIIDNKVESILSRSGKPTLACNALAFELEGLNLGTITIDGELGFQNTKPEDMFNRIGEYARKDHVVEDALFMVFDVVTDEPLTHEKRMDLFISIYGESKFIWVVPQYDIPDVKTFDEIYEKILEDGFEGIMLRNADSPYTEGRGNHLIKYKPFFSAEFKVLKAVEGSKFIVSQKKILPCISHLLVENEEGSCSVGSGLSELERLAWLSDPQFIEGKTITVNYQNKTLTDGKVSFRFPVFNGVRFD